MYRDARIVAMPRLGEVRRRGIFGAVRSIWLLLRRVGSLRRLRRSFVLCGCLVRRPLVLGSGLVHGLRLACFGLFGLGYVFRLSLGFFVLRRLLLRRFFFVGGLFLGCLVVGGRLGGFGLSCRSCRRS